MNTEMRGPVPEASGEASGSEGDDSSLGTAPTSGPEATSSQGNHKTIYVTCYPLNSGSGRVHGSTPDGDVLGCAMCECGEQLAEHLSSSEAFSQHDMGMSSDWKHDLYHAHCGLEFDLRWVTRDSEEWKRTLAINHARYPKEDAP